MRYLGLDLGTKTLGLSISDLTGTLASSYKTLRFEENDFEKVIEPLKEIVEEQKIKIFVLGFPKNMNNTCGEATKRVLNFKNLLEQNFEIKVELQDERLSTKEAHSYMIEASMSRKKRKEKIDSLAANIILQTYLDKIGGNYGK